MGGLADEIFKKKRCSFNKAFYLRKNITGEDNSGNLRIKKKKIKTGTTHKGHQFFCFQFISSQLMFHLSRASNIFSNSSVFSLN